MTYEEAKKLEIEWLKDSIKIRLYYLDPIKFKRFKSIADKNKIFRSEDVIIAWDVVSTIHKHEHGNIFEKDDLFFKKIKNG